jgi:hypothetical protein
VLKLGIPESEGTLFETILEPSAPEVERLRSDEGVDEGQINLLRNKINKLAVGRPYFRNLISEYRDENQELSHEIKDMINNYDFHYIRLSCTFIPDNDCRFDWARFGVELSSESKSQEPLSIKPIAHDLSPHEVFSEIHYRKESEITADLKLKFVDVGIGGKTGETKEYIIYEPEIIGSGINRSTVVWDFKKTKEKGLWGDKILILIIKAPKNNKVKGRFLFGGEVSSHLFNWIPIPVSKRKDDVINKEYDLSD